MSVVLLIPDGVGVRNFLIGSFLGQTSERSDCHVLHSIPDDLLDTYRQGLDGRVGWERLRNFREPPLASLLRYALGYAHQYWADTVAMRFVRSRPMASTWRLRTLHHTARLLGRAASSADGIRALDRWHCRAAGQSPEVEHYRRVFERIKPSVVFCSHQRPPSVIPPVLAARALGIPTATFIFSWDNLSSKGRIAAPFDHFFVWSELMRRELLTFYPDVTSDRVHVVGTPQFDPYADPALRWPRAQFFALVGADPARPLICYSGGDAGTAPEDQEHVRILMELIRAGQIKGNPQVILRPAPVDNGRRYEAVRRDFPELIYAPPAWVHAAPGEWSQTLPLPADVQFLANLTRHADLSINLASTMTLDFAIHDKPAVNIAFDVADPPPHGLPLWDYYYRFDHYRPVVEMGAARFARSRDELATHVNSYLADPTLDRAARRQFVELEVGLEPGASGRAISERLNSFARFGGGVSPSATPSNNEHLFSVQ
jgi:hypothetical protein